MENNKHTAIEKALTILNLFAPSNIELGTIEISRKLGFHKATTSRTLLLLAKYGFLEQNAETRKFKLGPAIVFLNLSINRTMENRLVNLSRSHLDRLRDMVKETVVLEFMAGRSTIIAYVADGPRPFRVSGEIGDIQPIHVAAGAKAIMAHLPQESWHRYLDRDLPKLTVNTITETNQLFRQYRRIKETGVAFDFGEHDVNINAIAAPVFNHEKRPVAAVVMVGLPGRLLADEHSRHVRKVRETAEQISRLMSEPYQQSEAGEDD